jgi:phosphatidylserine/phosphatidylglycerophosphate/cardiolipin synthase-like enzyme
MLKNNRYLRVLSQVLIIHLISFTLVFADEPVEFVPEALQSTWGLGAGYEAEMEQVTFKNKPISIHSLPRVLAVVRGVFGQPSKVKIISQAFEDLLILNPNSLKKVSSGELEAPLPFKVLSKEEEQQRAAGKHIPGITKSEFREKKILSEGRFIKLLRKAPEIWKDLEKFLEDHPRDSQELLEAKAELFNWRIEFRDTKYSIEHISHHLLKDAKHNRKQLAKQLEKDNSAKNKKAFEENEKLIAELEKELKELKSHLKSLRPQEKKLEAKVNTIWKELRKVDDKVFKELFADKLRSLLDTQNKINGFIRDNIDSKPVLLFMSPKDRAAGRTGYKLVDFQATSDLVYEDGKVEKGQSLDKMYVDFIKGAKRTLSLNFYEFDLPQMAEELVKAHKRGVKIRVSFDMDAMMHYPERMKLYYELRDYVRNAKADIDQSFHLSLIDSVSRNHQKLGVRDSYSKTKSLVLFGTANATYSGTMGDLASSALQHERAIANGNHGFTVQSYALANVVEHNLIKTQVMRMRGTSGIDAYPKSGSFLVKGPNGGYIVMAFTPNGGDGNVHETHTSRAINLTSGPVKTLQFSASSEVVVSALAKRAQRELKENKNWQLQALGDGSSFLSEWSIFLKIAGLQRLSAKEMKAKKVKFIEDPKSEWRKILGDQYERIMNDIRIAPSQYGMFYVKDEKGETLRDPKTGKAILISAKLHHKTFIAGIAFHDKETGKPVYAIVDGSANATDASLKNQEQIATIVDREFSEKYLAMFNGVWLDTSAMEEGLLRLVEYENLKQKDEKAAEEFKLRGAEQRTGLKLKKNADPKSCKKAFSKAS